MTRGWAPTIRHFLGGGIGFARAAAMTVARRRRWVGFGSLKMGSRFGPVSPLQLVATPESAPAHSPELVQACSVRDPLRNYVDHGRVGRGIEPSTLRLWFPI